MEQPKHKGHVNPLWNKCSDLYEQLTKWHLENLIIENSFDVSGQKTPACKNSSYPEIEILFSCNSDENSNWIFNLN